MFRYYALADVCYVCLRDVPLTGGSSPFRDSRWHRRGWTLQELLAPSVVFFLSESWEVLGSKADLAAELEEATGIPKSVLRRQTKLSDVSVARRMSWAAFRQTTRPEDEAYCLMGIFDVNMPTLYGEGRRAFQRLQEEIMKKSTDTTLFAWGRLFDFSQLGSGDGSAPCGLFATSPLPFRGCGGLIHREGAATRQPEPRKTGGGPATFATTPRGILAHMPVVEYGGWSFADLGWSENGQRVMLTLAPRRGGDSGLSHAVYDIRGDHRLVRMPNTNSEHKKTFIRLPAAKPLHTTWKDIYIAYGRASFSPKAASLPPIPINHHVSAPFRFPERRIENFARLINGNFEDVQNADLPWTGNPPTTFTFRVSNTSALAIKVGMCPSHPHTSPPSYLEDAGSPDSRLASPMWANVQWHPRSSTNNMPSELATDHDCATDHVLEWPALKKTFVLLPDGSHRENYKFYTLSFTRCPVSTAGTLILDASVEEQSVPRTLGENVRIIPVDDWVVYAL
ncbi:hypothetical protein C8T65DRAFT_657366 [Cerioporus squamosus]|nr:hypothetical protein C8T65DRAFT_657366 [Cerioporus squamosus]